MSAGRRGPNGLTDFERDICHAVDKGLTNRAAYRAVRPNATASDVTCEQYVWRVRQRPQCVAYLKELKAKSLARHLDAKDQIIEELALVAFSDIGDLLVSGPDGLTVKPIDTLPSALRRPLSGITIRRTAHGDTVRLRMHDKLRALEKLSQMLGLNDPAARPGAGNRTEPLSELERAQRVAALLRIAAEAESGTAEGEAAAD
ncbi:MAG: terminase small subunit [Rhodospirillaceae bacterium]|nr:terminase small subunit [Rhodospirillaceae bacterium]